MTAGLSALFWGIVTLSLLVLVHEGGHYLAARFFGVRVREFMIGLPGPKLSFKRNDTLFGVTAIPLGGYVKVVGMEGDQYHDLLEPVLAYITVKRTVTLDQLASTFDLDENEMYAIVVALRDLQAVEIQRKGPITALFPKEQAEDPDALFAAARADSYLTLPARKRIAILLAGIVLNLAMAIIVFTVVLAGWGIYTDLGYIDPVADAPAMEAGIPAQARIISLDGVAVFDFMDLSREIQTHQVGDEVSVVYRVDEVERTASVILAANPEGATPFLGVSPHYVQVPLSIGEAFTTSLDYLWQTVTAIAGFFNPARFTETIEQSASVVGIAVIAAEAVKAGPYEYAWLIAAISLSLGLMNLLPIPPLDGGKIVLELVERVRHKPLSMRTNLAVSAVGFSLLFTLMAYLIYHDIGRFVAR
jgi:regulator of sigma E protease